jgi:hypothetical protein
MCVLDLACGSGEMLCTWSRDLPGLVELFGQLGWDLVQMVLADEDSWDRYVAAQWITVRDWPNADPHDELAGEFRIERDTAPAVPSGGAAAWLRHPAGGIHSAPDPGA